MSEDVLKFEDSPVLIKFVRDGEMHERSVPARLHPMAPGLAVTMGVFGRFEVTHIPTGARMTGSSSRDGLATHYMACFAAIAKANGFAWSEVTTPEGAKERIDAIGSHPVPFKGATWKSKEGEKPMTILEWVRIVGSYTPNDDFPWEAPSEDPIEGAVEILESLREAA